MAFALPQSQPSASIMLDLFLPPPVDIAIESSRTVQYRPVSSLGDGSHNLIEFVLPGGQMYTDFSSMLLEVRLQVMKLDATGKEANLTDTESAEIGTEQYLLHSCFEEVELTLGNKVVTPSLGTYAFRSYIEALLSYGSDAKNSFLTTEGWIGGLPKDDVDPKRSKLIKGSRVVHLLGRPHLDLCFQDRLLLNHVDVRLRLLKAKDSFILMNKTTGATKVDAKVRIVECNLYVKQVTVSPDVELGHASALKDSPALYPIRRSIVRVFPISQGSVTGLIDNLSGQVPNRLIVGLTTSKAANGRVTESGLAFSHFNATYFSCHLNGEPVPVDPFLMDFDKRNYTRAYLSVFHTLNNFGNDTAGVPPISYQDYGEHNVTLWGVTLTPEGTVSDSYTIPLKQGVLRLEFHFKSPLTESLTCVVFMEMDNNIRINMQREVILDY